MSHSLWHCGVLMGQAELEARPDTPRHLVGILQPTAYGRRLLPRLTGLLSAAASLKERVEASGMTAESVAVGDAASEFILSAAGRGLVDVGRALSEVELRDPSGVTLKFQSIAFVDLAELRSVAHRLRCHAAIAELESVPQDAPHVIVSATLAPQPRCGMPTGRPELS